MHENLTPPDAVDFNDEQKQYLAGFVAGSDLARTSRGLSTWSATLAQVGALPVIGSALAALAAPALAAAPGLEPIHRTGQDRFLSEGRKLCPEEEAKRGKNPLDLWDEMVAHAEAGKFPKGSDVLFFKYHGLFHVAPAQDSFMCRLRFAGGILRSHQLRGLASLSEELAGGYVDVTTRSNLQLREIRPQDSIKLLTGLLDLGIVPRGSGADNLRNITATPTAGFDMQELIDTRPLAHELHHYILNHREMYGLPRKFNVAYDGGGTISSLEDTNDIGFAAVRVGAGQEVPPGVYLRVELGGITGHKDFARDTGLLLEARQCLPVAVAMIRTFIEHGDRTDRKKARLKYLLDRWGFEKFLEETQARVSFPLRRFPLEQCELRGPVAKHAHVGVHPQRQPDKHYVGVVLPVGRINPAQMRGLAALADRYGSGELRLTVWQNLLLPDISSEDLPAVQDAIHAMGLDWRASSLRGALVACTGNAGCKFAAANTKKHAMELIAQLEARIEIDHPLNIHLTGCPHSCAQHYLGDIGLLGTKVEVGEDLVEGYHVYVGGGYGAHQAIGREMYRSVPATELVARIEGMLRGYQENRIGSAESFQDFTRRFEIDALRAMFEPSSVRVLVAS